MYVYKYIYIYIYTSRYICIYIHLYAFPSSVVTLTCVPPFENVCFFLDQQAAVLKRVLFFLEAARPGRGAHEQVQGFKNNACTHTYVYEQLEGFQNHIYIHKN